MFWTKLRTLFEFQQFSLSGHQLSYSLFRDLIQVTQLVAFGCHSSLVSCHLRRFLSLSLFSMTMAIFKKFFLLVC